MRRNDREKKLRFIGITGGIGAGKSEILHYIQQNYPCEVYLADNIAHLVEQPGNKCYEALVELLGAHVVGEGGELDRQAMAEEIFGRQELLDQVNAIVHPAVKEYLLNRLENARRAGNIELFFVEAALLIECGYLALVDEMWYIYADEAVRRERLRAGRGYSDEKISRIMAQQLTEDHFRANCDFVIDNSGSFQESIRQIEKRLGRENRQ